MASNPLLKFRDEILDKVIYPKLYGILYSEKGNFSTRELWQQFRKKHECSVSLREFKEWLVVMGLEPQQVTTWNIPAPTLQEIEESNYQLMKVEENTVDTVAFEPPQPDDPNINFDNE